MKIKRLPSGMLGSNCYIVAGDGEGIVIDPGVDCGEILAAASALGVRIRYIILTHAHIDHILSMDELRDRSGAEVAVHEMDGPALPDVRLNGSLLFGLRKTFGSADILLKDGDKLNAGGVEIRVIHTPGHTPGGICLQTENHLFTGDTLFYMSVGRTDLGNGDHDSLMESIRNKLLVLEDDTVVLPGHGTSTTIGFEKKNNPFI